MTPEIKERIEQIRRGEVPEGYKKTKTGIVPVEWEEKRIGDVLKQRKTLMCISEDAPLLSFTIEEGVIDPADKKSNKRDFLIKDMATKKFALTKVGDIIYNPANLKFGAIHRNNLRRGVVSPIYGIFYGEQNSEFMGYLLHNQRFIDYAKTYTEGTVEKLKTLKADTFLKLKITLPPLAEQKKIVEILTAQDKLIELQNKKIEQLKMLKRIYTKSMFPKKGANLPELRFKSFFDTWKQSKLGDEVTEMIAGGDVDKKLLVKKGMYPVIANALNDDGIVGYYENTFRVNAPAVTVTGRGDVGHAKARFANFTPIVRLLAIKSKHDVLFLENAINTLHIIVESTGVPQLTIPQLSQYKLMFPSSLEEERAIGTVLGGIDHIIALNRYKLNEEKQKKKALTQLLLSGIVRV